MSGVESQFGFDEALLLAEGAAERLKLPNLTLNGVHVYFGTQVASVEALAKNTQCALDTAVRVSTAIGFDCSVINAGGGFPWPYASDATGSDLAGLREALETVWQASPLHGKAQLCFESGRYLCAGSGTLLTTVLDVKIATFPTHAASKPLAMIPNCAATRHAHFVMDGSGPVYMDPPSLDLWPKVDWEPNTETSKRVDLNTLTKEEVASWKPGQTLLLNGKMLTGRDAAHKRIQDMLAKGEKLPVDFTNRVIYYVGPVDPVGDEVVGPAGPTTATRMDKFTDMMLAQTGLIAMVGKAERGPTAIEAIKKHQSAYLMAVGGAAYLVSKAIKGAKVVGFADLGMEAIYEFDVVDMPVTVAVDAGGTSAHITGPAEWQKRIATGEFKGISVNAG